MKKLYTFMRILVWSFIGVIIGSSIFQYYDYKTHPGLYAYQSAPWYLSIEIRGAFTAVIVLAILSAMWLMKKRMKKNRKE